MTDGLFEGMDAPRPLSEELRLRLQEPLLSATARPLDPSFDARLESTLTDPVAAALRDLDRPRALAPAQRAALTRALPRRRRMPWLAGAAAAVAALVAGLSLLTGPSHGSRPSASGLAPSAAATSALPRATGASDAVTGTVQVPGAAGGGVSGPVTAPLPQSGTVYSAAAKLVVTPATAPAGALVRLSGTDLRTVVSVRFGQLPGTSLAVRADGTVTVRVPPGAAAGTRVDVTAVLADGRRLVAPQAFRYRAA